MPKDIPTYNQWFRQKAQEAVINQINTMTEAEEKLEKEYYKYCAHMEHQGVEPADYDTWLACIRNKD